MASDDRIDNRIFVLVLQHPQEKKKELGTGALTVARLRNAMIKVGLSWPNLGRILGRPVEPSRWAVLYLGAAKDAPPKGTGPVIAVDRKSVALPRQDEMLSGIDGLVLLDGNWAQSKTLWWRNPWLLKLRRLVLLPDRPSAYGSLRREPRSTSVSTIEAAGICLARLEGRPEIRAALDEAFASFLTEFRGAPPKSELPQ